MRSFDRDTAKYWCDKLEVGLRDTPARETWRRLQKMVGTYFPGRGTLFEETYLAGQADGEAKGVLRVLEVRALPVCESVRERITTCTDLDRLNDWLYRSGTVTHAEELFAEESEAQEDGASQI